MGAASSDQHPTAGGTQVQGSPYGFCHPLHCGAQCVLGSIYAIQNGVQCGQVLGGQ